MKPLFYLLLLSLFGMARSTDGNTAHFKAFTDTIAYRSYTVDIKSQKVALFARQGAIKASFTPLMITNGGMFDPDYSPHGLLVCGHKVYKKLDTRTAKGANFYIQPNGVFLFDNGKYAVIATKQYRLLYSQGNPEFGTQSGPMLVTNDSINSIFDKHSEYITTRSGVGILPDGNPVFIIAEGINFYDFASIFKNTFHCKNALFLDGGLSEMFIGAKDVQRLAEYNFGPVIAVLKK